MKPGSPVKCVNRDCHVADTGKCVEGLPVEKCPNYRNEEVSGRGASDVGSAEESESGATGEDALETIALPTGEKLDVPEAEALLRAGDCRVIALVGPNDVGKTTLVAALYEMFQRGTFGDFAFAGSRTLYAFERACHLARAASRRATPDTEHTGLGEGLGFFHLGLVDQVSWARLAFLLGDRSGEAYKATADDPVSAREFVEVRRADVLTLLVDGKRLVSKSARHNLISETKMILQGLVDADIVASRHRLAIILTKYDEVKISTESERAEHDFEKLVADLERLFGPSFDSMVHFSVAASPSPGCSILPRGYGLEALLNFWALPPATSRYAASAPKVALRAFSRLTGRPG